jgi:Rod binding domain-containing protein
MNGATQNTGNLAMDQSANLSIMNRFARRQSQKDPGEAAKEFEGMFMTQMLQPMFDTVSVDPQFGGGHGEEMMRGFLVQEYGKIVSKNSHLGIADAVRDEMQRIQGKVNAKTTTQQYGAAYAAGQIQ